MDRRMAGIIMAGAGLVLVVVSAASLLGGATTADTPGDGPSAAVAASTPSDAPATTTTSTAPASTTSATASTTTSTTTTSTAAASTTSTAPSNTTASTTSAPDTTATTTRTVDPTIDVEEAAGFFESWSAELLAGDVERLKDSLHPVVIDTYGTAQCNGYLSGIVGQEVGVEVRDVTPPGPGVFDRDDLAIPLDEVVVVTLYRSDIDRTVEARLARVEGEIRWFTDCGIPEE
ncbi:MAG TPA: hypothetical protein ENI86_06160 [Acidimicrobiales bacterium]|nr:hypothetical protein [Acidimicrobiales bacterium]